MRRWPAWLCFGATALYLATGLVVVAPDEVGVVRSFGVVSKEALGPGLHWTLPLGLGRVDRVKPGQARTLTIGAGGPEDAPLGRAPDSSADDFLTGDRNLVTVQLQLQYRVADPAAFLFGSAKAEQALALEAESALSQSLASRGIDDLLTTGRNEVADQIVRLVQSRADRDGLGVSIRAARLSRVSPPSPVAPAFADADRARSDRRQKITQADEYRDRAMADARGLQREIADKAAADRDRLVRVAQGESERFRKVLAEASKAPEATRNRLYLEAIGEILPRFRRKVVVEPGNADLGIVSGGSIERDRE
ncbi:MAG: FtsH protease activity modulator HflK [Isosphaeraceae bacterium]